MLNHNVILKTLLMLLVFSISVVAAPQLIDYQGFLEDDNGNPITDTLDITFKIYDASSGGSTKWTETQNSVAILGGLFNVTLGSSTSILDTVFNADSRYLSITIGGTEILPRTRILCQQRTPIGLIQSMELLVVQLTEK